MGFQYLNLFVEKIKKFLVATFQLDKHLRTVAIYIQVNVSDPFWEYNRAHIRPEKARLRAMLKTYTRQGMEYCMEVIESVNKIITDFFKKPTN